jgi:hypothetical protein
MYVLGTDYRFVKQQTLVAGSQREIDGLCWIPGANMPSDDSLLYFDYSYNRTIAITDALIDANRQISTDVLCREAIEIGLKVRLIIQNTLGASNENVYAGIQSALQTWAATIDYGSWIQFSDIESIVSTVIGVDSCRVAMPSDANRIVSYGANKGKAVGSGLSTVQKFKHYLNDDYQQDFRLWDSMLLSIDSVDIVREGANTYSLS